MSSITISQLPLAGTIQDSGNIVIDTAGVTQRFTANTLKSYLSAGSLSSITATSGTLTTLTAGTINTTSDVSIGGNLVVAGNLSAVITTTNQPYITTLGNITAANLVVNSNLSTGNLSVSGITTHSGAILPVSNVAAVNIGSTSSWFNNVYGTAVHALYADLAERYTSDASYPPGTVVVFGTDTEVTASYKPNDPKVAGVVSTNPAYTMNAGTAGVDVALQGRVPCQVMGVVNRGDMMVTGPIPGVAIANDAPAMGTVIGKALENYNSDTVGIIEVVVGRL